MDAQAQEEIETLKREIEQLKKLLGERQQLDQPKSLPALRDNYEFVTDMTRFAEGLYSEAAIRKKYHFNENAWDSLGKDDALVERIEAEKLRRVRDGSFKREKAQQLIVKGPEILDGIMTDPKANAKHKVDAIKTLDSLADPGPQRTTADEERVIVTINLGNDILRFGGPVKPTPNPSDDKIIDAVPGFMIPAKDGNDGGQPL